VFLDLPEQPLAITGMDTDFFNLPDGFVPSFSTESAGSGCALGAALNFVIKPMRPNFRFYGLLFV
jgi:hypothetical protein